MARPIDPTKNIGKKTSSAINGRENDPSEKDKGKFIYNTNKNDEFLDTVAPIQNNPNVRDIVNANKDNKNSDIESLLRSRGIYSRRYIDRGLYNAFNRFGYNLIDPYNIPTVTREYVFFTKPDLNILTTSGGVEDGLYKDLNKSLLNYPFFTDAYSRYRAVLEDLCWSHSVRKIDPIYNSSNKNTGGTLDYNIRNNFIPLLSNTLTSTLQLPDKSAEYIETNGNVYGTKVRYRGSSSGSKNFTFSLEFQDTRFYDVYMFFRIYDEYITLKNLGIVGPKQRQIWRKILHDQFSIYKITVDEDGTTITHFAKYTGVFPTSVPTSMFSDMNNTDPKGRLSIEFNAFEVEDMNPYILREFNSVSSSPLNGINNLMKLKECELYNSKAGHANGDWAKYPYIYWDNLEEGSENINTSNSGHRKYFLRWKYGSDTDALISTTLKDNNITRRNQADRKY